MATFTVTQTTPNKEKLYLRPNANSACVEWDPVGAGNNYQCVDEVLPNYGTDYVETSDADYQIDLYDIPDSADLGVINYLKVWAVVRIESSPPPNVDFKLILGDETIGPSTDEDFTTYTLVDEACGHIDVQTATHIRWVSDMRHTDYLYYDFGVDYFEDTFEHCCAVRADEYTDVYASAYYNAVTNDIGDQLNWGDDWISNRWYRNRIYLDVTIGGVPEVDYYVGVLDVWYYIKTVRNGDGTVNTYIYSDAERTVLLDTLLCITDDETIDFRYKYAVSTRDSGLNRTVTLDFDNLNLTCTGGSSCDDVYESDSKYLVTAWRKVSNVWDQDPDTDADWTWDGINNSKIGIKGKSVFDAAELSKVLRPDGDGTTNNWTPVGEVNRWECVDDEPVHDGDATYIRSANPGTLQLFTLEDFADAGMSITGITVFIVARASASASGTVQIALRSGGSNYTSTSIVLPRDNNWVQYSRTWNTNPDTSMAWTPAQLDALEAGVYDVGFGFGDNIYVTQIFVTVNYEYASAPPIQCTQVYAEVGYEPSTVTCTLNKPRQISTNHARNVKMLNFWNGDREVYDLNRSGKSMVLVGEEMYTGACDKILCMRNIARNGAVITIAGLTPTYWNTDYRIKEFGWDKISEKPEHYKWILSLERAD